MEKAATSPDGVESGEDGLFTLLHFVCIVMMYYLHIYGLPVHLVKKWKDNTLKEQKLKENENPWN
jgi:hypothetical protein